jgi:RNA recognition motif-containing protein
VERNTFWEVDIEDLDGDSEDYAFDLQTECEFELRVDKDDCMSEPSSEVTTRPPSIRWSEQASEGSESDHEDAFQESFPPSCKQGNSAVGQVPMFYYMPTVMVAAPLVPASQNLPARSAQKKKPKSNKDTRTTLMIQNVPAQCTNNMMVEMLDSAGLSCKYDFVYAPTDFRTYTAFGYAFVNFTTNKNAVQAMDVLSGLICPTWSEQKVAFEVNWCEAHQGLKVHVNKYQNSPVMHPSVLEEYKPLIFKNGLRQQFPPPTKVIKEPRLRRSNPAEAQ